MPSQRDLQRLHHHVHTNLGRQGFHQRVLRIPTFSTVRTARNTFDQVMAMGFALELEAFAILDAYEAGALSNRKRMLRAPAAAGRANMAYARVRPRTYVLESGLIGAVARM
jgi:hypothetical protein